MKGNNISLDCVSNERFMELVADNIKRNFEKTRQELPGMKLPKTTGNGGK